MSDKPGDGGPIEIRTGWSVTFPYKDPGPKVTITGMGVGKPKPPPRKRRKRP